MSAEKRAFTFLKNKHPFFQKREKHKARLSISALRQMERSCDFSLGAQFSPPFPKVTYCTFRLSQALRCKLHQAEGSLKNKERLRKDLKNGCGKDSEFPPERGETCLQRGAGMEIWGFSMGASRLEELRAEAGSDGEGVFQKSGMEVKASAEQKVWSYYSLRR